MALLELRHCLVINRCTPPSQIPVEPSIHTAGALRKRIAISPLFRLQVSLAVGPRAERLSVLCACSVEGMLCARLYTKGAAELLLQQCSSRLSEGIRAERLSQGEKSSLLESFAADGNRSASLPSPARILHTPCGILTPLMTHSMTRRGVLYQERQRCGQLPDSHDAVVSGFSPGMAAL